MLISSNAFYWTGANFFWKTGSKIAGTAHGPKAKRFDGLTFLQGTQEHLQIWCFI